MCLFDKLTRWAYSAEADAASDYRRLSGQTTNLMDCLLNAPRGEPLVLDLSRESVRDLVL